MDQEVNTGGDCSSPYLYATDEAETLEKSARVREGTELRLRGLLKKQQSL